MGKDTTKSLSSNASRLYSPWLMSDGAKKPLEVGSFGHFFKNDDIEVYMDKEMTLKILEIEKQQLELFQKNKEDDEEEEDVTILQQAQHMNLYPQEDTTVFVPESDLQLEHLLAVSESQHIPLLTLKDKVTTDSVRQEDCNSLSASDPAVKKVYKRIGLQLSRDPLIKPPTKACKILPSIPNWDEILYLTNPAKWSPQAIYDMTLIFIKTVKFVQTTQYYRYVLLPLTRQNLNTKGILDRPIYFALQKAISSNATIFIKGFIGPLCESNSCTVPEALMLSSIISQTKIKSNSYSTALYLLSSCIPTLPICILVLAFLKKPQLMTQSAIDYMANKFFCRPGMRVYPIIWYQALFIFVDRHGWTLCGKRQIVDLMKSVPRNEFCDSIDAITKKWVISEEKEEEEEDEEDSATTPVYNNLEYGENEDEEGEESDCSDESMAID